MAIEIRETFEVQAPIDSVWHFVMEPQRVVTCIPGAELEEVVDDRTFVGRVKIKVGAVTTSYKGRVVFAEIDPQDHRVQMRAEGRETGGGTATGTMSSQLRSLPSGRTEVLAAATVDLTGRIMQVGRGMIQGVSNQLFQQFVASLKQQLEIPGAVAPPPAEAKPIRVLPLLFKTLCAGILGFLRRLFGPRA